MEPTCVHCGSDKEPYFSRSEPMGDYCSECGHNFYERPTPETDAFWDDVCESWSNWSVNEGHEKLLELARRLERERNEARSDLEFRRDLFKLQEEQLNKVRDERDQYRGLLIRLHNDLFVHHGGQAVSEFKELFREENYN